MSDNEMRKNERCAVCGKLVGAHLKCAACGVLVGPGHYEEFLVSDPVSGQQVCPGCLSARERQRTRQAAEAAGTDRRSMSLRKALKRPTDKRHTP